MSLKNLNDITPDTVDPGSEYTHRIGEVHTVEELREVVMDFAPLVPDVIELLDTITFTPEGLQEFLMCLMDDTSPVQLDADMGNLVFPRILLAVGLVALEEGLPWGTAFLNMIRQGVIEVRDGSAYLTQRIELP